MAIPNVAVRKAGLRNSPFRRVAIWRLVLRGVKLSEWRLRDEHQEECQQDSRGGTDVKRSAPSVFRTHQAAQYIAQRGSHRDGQIKDSHHPAALVLRKHVRNEGRRKRDEARLTDAYQRMPDEQFVEVVREGRQQRRSTP